MKGKIAILFGVPVETGDISRWHDRRQDVGSCAARMRKRGTRTRKQGGSETKADCRRRSRNEAETGEKKRGGGMILPPETLMRTPGVLRIFCMARAASRGGRRGEEERRIGEGRGYR